MDWAQGIICELRSLGLEKADDATRHFCNSYSDGDSGEAWDKYSTLAERREDFQPGNYTVLVFPDGSVYADWNQGIDRFYPSLSDLMDEDEDARDRFTDDRNDCGSKNT